MKCIDPVRGTEIWMIVYFQIAHKYTVQSEQRVRELLEGHLGKKISEEDFPFGGIGLHHLQRDGTVLREYLVLDGLDFLIRKFLDF